MKLDAAALLESNRPLRVTLLLSLFLAFLFLAGTASALDGIDISAMAASANAEDAKAADDGACPRLIQIKYPFLHCAHGEIGLADADDDWENSRQIPLQTRFVEGDGYFGPDLNQARD